MFVRVLIATIHCYWLVLEGSCFLADFLLTFFNNKLLFSKYKTKSSFTTISKYSPPPYNYERHSKIQKQSKT